MSFIGIGIYTLREEVIELCENLESLSDLYVKRQLSFPEVESRLNKYRPQAICFMSILKQRRVVTCDEENVMRCMFSEHTAGAVLQKTPELLRRFIDRLPT